MDDPLAVVYEATHPRLALEAVITTSRDTLAAARIVEPKVDAIDLNLGCPQRIAHSGHFGSFLLDDEDRPLESYLFAICGYKLTDYLRREGRRPVLELRRNTNQETQDQAWVGPHRVASSIVRSAEQKQIEEQVIQTAISEQIEHWKRTDQWTKLKVIEMIYVKGSGNKQVAELLAISEQKVANYKSDFQMKLRSIIQRMNLEQHVFPELYETPAPEQ